MVSKERGEQFIHDKLEPVLHELENLRLELLEKGKRNKLLLSGFGILIFLYTYTIVQAWAETGFQRFWMSGLLIVLLVTAYLAFRPEFFLPQSERNRFLNLYRNGIIRESLRFINRSFNYQPIYKTNIRTYEKSKLFIRKITEYRERNSIVGQIEQAKLRICEAQLRNNLQISFDGWFVQFETPTHLPNCILTTLHVDEILLTTHFKGMHSQHTQGITTLQTKPIGTTICHTLADELRQFKTDMNTEISLSIIDSQIYLAIPQKLNMYTLSFRDDNQNILNTRRDIQATINLFNHLETISRVCYRIHA
jgi:hypothetical protein